MKIMDTKYQSGFTLIELMIAVAIIGIITVLTYPSYTDNVRRTNRADVRGILLENAQFMQRVFTENDSFFPRATPATAPTLPFLVAPRNATGSNRKYTIAVVVNAGGMGYTLTATPIGSMITDVCGTYTLTDLGAKNAASGSPGGGLTVDDCWNK
ncbi:MAG: type IV pilin protein [Undibacterium sp.]|nr:type IV pilin protein [Undibacterium sp.]